MTDGPDGSRYRKACSIRIALLRYCALHKISLDSIYWKKEIIMPATGTFRFSLVGQVFGVMRAARAVSIAVESRRRPQNADLITLGIDPQAFNRDV